MGRCAAGTQVCGHTGTDYGQCNDESLPGQEACGTGIDADCDGNLAPPCDGTGLWTRGFGALWGQAGFGVAIDAAGGVTTVGDFMQTVDFGNGPVSTVDEYDAFVMKYDAGGNLLWTRSWGGLSYQVAWDVAADAAGNLLVIGDFFDKISIDGTTLVDAQGLGSGDAFVAKLAPDGTVLWTRHLAGSGDEFGRGIAVDPLGNVVIAGAFEGTTDFGLGPITASYIYDIYVAELDPDGNTLWVKTFGDATVQVATSVAVANDGSVALTGYFDGTLAFTGSPLTTHGGYDAFVAKLDSAGNPVWSKRFGDADDQEGWDVAFGPSGDVVVTGEFAGTVDFGNGPLASAGGHDAFIAAFDANGVPSWSKRYGDAADDLMRSVAIDAGGNIVATGWFEGAIDFGAGSIPSAGSQDAFLLKLDSLGNLIWSKTTGGASPETGRSIAVDAAGNIAATGSYATHVDLGSDVLSNTDGQEHVYVSRVAP